MWNYEQRSFTKGSKRGKVFGEEFMCIHGNPKEKNVWKCGLDRGMVNFGKENFFLQRYGLKRGMDFGEFICMEIWDKNVHRCF